MRLLFIVIYGYICALCVPCIFLSYIWRVFDKFKNICSDIIECVGPEELSFKDIIKKLLISIEKKRLLIPIPIQIAKVIALLFEIFPKPLITRDQLKILKYDNTLSGEFKSNIDIGFKAKLKFGDEILKYSFMWKKGGQYSK